MLFLNRDEPFVLSSVCLTNCSAWHGSYYQPLDDPETILLIDSWENQEAIDIHHASPMMATIAALREKYDLHMTVERYVSAETPETENRFIRE